VSAIAVGQRRCDVDGGCLGARVDGDVEQRGERDGGPGDPVPAVEDDDLAADVVAAPVGGEDAMVAALGCRGAVTGVGGQQLGGLQHGGREFAQYRVAGDRGRCHDLPPIPSEQDECRRRVGGTGSYPGRRRFQVIGRTKPDSVELEDVASFGSG
jgi:hypothetical protein